MQHAAEIPYSFTPELPGTNSFVWPPSQIKTVGEELWAGTKVVRTPADTSSILVIVMETVMVTGLVSACTGGRQTPARPRPSEEKRVIRRSKARSCVKSNILDYKIKCIYGSEF